MSRRFSFFPYGNAKQQSNIANATLAFNISSLYLCCERNSLLVVAGVFPQFLEGSEDE